MKENYDGRRHFEKIAPLIKEGDSQGAWQYGLNACFWTFPTLFLYHRLRKVPAEMQMMMAQLSRDISEDKLWPIVSKNIGLDP